MNTFLSRANTIFAFTLSVMAVLTFGCFASTFLNDNLAHVNIKTAKPIVKNMPDYSVSREKNDLGFITFDLRADLNPIFNWNVKQLFLYLTAEYVTGKNVINQVVLWDQIIKRGDNSILDYHGMNPKYYFWDDGNGLRANKNVTLTLSWNVIPNAGTLPKVMGSGSHSFAFPESYASNHF
ncbi:hypothetical protein CAPTEDRAFT_225712 [Capitella teleta]|uniref:Signal peptidase complex subunit 3 n=1 Tax=Capitella teleta TaxID=283909 RepID=R7URT3_CAPTE|nr:hypothetical protein CAPTEDRAFT_225712 [Capitella teleta]|eukprot:ELU08915.1 hypothetical protein CAPTEDRAFT_225712 [Capitella teleta]